MRSAATPTTPAPHDRRLQATAANFPAAGAACPAAQYNGKYDGLSFGSGGVALTYAGFTLGANAIGGRLNGQLALAPQGGAPEVAYTVGLKYMTGPLTVGVVGEIGWYQGDVRLTGITQRRARAITAGGTYTVAPGLMLFSEYLWQEIHQGNFNFDRRDQFQREQQLPQPGLHDRQRDELLRPSSRSLRNRRRGHPRRSFLLEVRMWCFRFPLR